MGYTDAISIMIDFKKINGPSDAVFQKLVIDRIVAQKSTQNSGKDDEIAVDTRSRQ